MLLPGYILPAYLKVFPKKQFFAGKTSGKLVDPVCFIFKANAIPPYICILLTIVQ